MPVTILRNHYAMHPPLAGPPAGPPYNEARCPLSAGVALPSVTTLLAKHVPAAQRTKAVGTVFAGFHRLARPQPPAAALGLSAW